MCVRVCYSDRSFSLLVLDWIWSRKEFDSLKSGPSAYLGKIDFSSSLSKSQRSDLEKMFQMIKRQSVTEQRVKCRYSSILQEIRVSQYVCSFSGSNLTSAGTFRGDQCDVCELSDYPLVSFSWLIRLAELRFSSIVRRTDKTRPTNDTQFNERNPIRGFSGYAKVTLPCVIRTVFYKEH